MNLKLEEYIGGARVKLTVNDAPMTAIKALVNHFVMACTDVETAQDAEPMPAWFGVDRATDADSVTVSEIRVGGQSAYVFGEVTTETVPAEGSPFAPADGPEINASDYDVRVAGMVVRSVPSLLDGVEDAAKSGGTLSVLAEEAPKRKRRTKAEMAAERGGILESVEGPVPQGLSISDDYNDSQKALNAERSAQVEQLAATEPAVEDEPPLPLADTAETAPVASANLEPASTDTSPVDTPADPVTDSDLNAFCVKVAQHYGKPQPVYDLAAPFVPEGMPARPTNIRDNAQRWAFVRAAEAASGVKYHG